MILSDAGEYGQHSETTLSTAGHEFEASIEGLPEPAANSRPTASGKRSNEKALVRRIATKYGELASASAGNLELLSAALGVPNTTVDLTIAVVSASRSDLSPLTDTLSLTGPLEALDVLVAAISLGRVRIKGVWTVLTNLGQVTGALPTGDVKAGGAIAKAAGELGQDDLDEIAAVLKLAKK